MRQILTISLSSSQLQAGSGLQLAYDSHQFPPSSCLFLQTVCKHLQISHCAKLVYHQNIMMVAASLTIQSMKLLPPFRLYESKPTFKPWIWKHFTMDFMWLLTAVPCCHDKHLRFQLKIFILDLRKYLLFTKIFQKNISMSAEISKIYIFCWHLVW